MEPLDFSALSAQVLAAMRERVQATRSRAASDILPRLEEVAALATEASVLRLGGAPNPELEQVLQARFQNLAAAAGLDLADVVRDSARDALTTALRAAFGLAIAAVAP